MDTVFKEVGDKKIYYQVYNGTNAIYEYMESMGQKNAHFAQRSADFWNVNDSAKEGVSGMGVESREEGTKYLKYGFDKELQRVKERFNKKNRKQEGMVKGARIIRDVVGEMVCVPEAIMGIPTYMRRRVNLVKKAKVIRLIVLTGFPWHVGAAEIAEAGARITAAAKEVERQGNRMEIYVGEVTECSGSGQEGTFCVTKVKNADQPFDLKRVGFAMCCAGMPRWLMMAWKERAKGIPDAGGNYGYAAARSWGKEKVKEIAKSILGRNSVVLIQDGSWKDDPEVIANKILKEANEVTNVER